MGATAQRIPTAHRILRVPDGVRTTSRVPRGESRSPLWYAGPLQVRGGADIKSEAVTSAEARNMDLPTDVSEIMKPSLHETRQ
jgi:hypothetical protein